MQFTVLAVESSRPPKKPELLAPGGSLEKCLIAFLYGADAVYVGGKEFSLRAYARNLNGEELAAACHAAHRVGKKLYVTINIFARQSDLKKLPPYLQYLEDIQVDGLIVSDPGIILLVRQLNPALPIHLSTQANTTNGLSAIFWQNHGVHRINLARELSLEDLREIRIQSDVELEVFVHGSMCVSYSGRCLLSAFMSGRSANRGLCSQPCRWSYRLVEEKRPGEYFPIHEDSRGTYIFNSADLCLLDEVGTLISHGIDAFKVEGRMKGALYLASVVRTYRQAIDGYWASPRAFEIQEALQQELQKLSHRPYTKAFLFPESNTIPQGVAAGSGCIQTHTLAGMVRPSPVGLCGNSSSQSTDEKDWTYIEVRSRLRPGTILDFLDLDGTASQYVLECMEDLKGNLLEVAHPNSWIRIPAPFPTFPLQVIRTPQEAG